MIERQAVVVSTEGDIAHVEVLRESGCASCSLKSGCGTGTIGQMFLSKCIRHEVRNTQNARAGDNVVLGIDERNLVKTSFIIYILPLLGLFGFALLGEAISRVFFSCFVEWITVLGGCAGLLVSFILMKSPLVTWFLGNIQLEMLKKL